MITSSKRKKNIKNIFEKLEKSKTGVWVKERRS